MTSRQRDQAVDIPGESFTVVRRLGFRTESPMPDDPEPEELRLVLDCPFCRQAVPYPGLVGGGLTPLAECLICDVYFEFGIDEVYASEARNDVDSRA